MCLCSSVHVGVCVLTNNLILGNCYIYLCDSQNLIYVIIRYAKLGICMAAVTKH